MSSPDAEDFATRVQRIDWSAYRSAYGNAKEMGVDAQLIALVGNEDAALAAASDLWAGLCHQHAYVSSAAGPGYPFLVEVLRSANAKLSIEILDTLVGFAICTLPGFRNLEDGAWVQKLRSALLADKQLIATLAKHGDIDVKEFAEWLLSLLEMDHINDLPSRKELEAQEGSNQ